MLALIDKPKGYTSFAVIRKLKKLFYGEKIWHSWTLDPMATGLLVIWMGKDTKKLQSIQWMDKDYITTVDFSKLTDTWDMDYWDYFEEFKVVNDKWQIGIIKNWSFVKAPNIEDIKSILDGLIPECELPLPNFSAKKVGWKKLYDLARTWKNLDLSRVMKIYSYEIISYNFPTIELKLTVWSWCYIRSIWYFLGYKFWLGGILTSLRRTRIWNYKL